MKAPVAPLPRPFSWTGFYVGANVGGAWAQRNITDSLTGVSFDHTSNGLFIGGGQTGFNYQINSFVVGLEGDFDGAFHNDRPSGGVLVPGVGTIQVSSNNTLIISTAAARFGLAFDRWLFYGKAGGGWIGNANFTLTNLTTGTTIADVNNRNSSGFLGGAGIEYGFGNNVTVKLEYDYLGLGSRTFVVPVGSPFLVGDRFTNSSRNVQMVKVGLNYLFNTTAGY